MLFSDELPDGLVPFKDRLSPAFFEVRERVASFITEEVLPRMSQFKQEREALQREVVAKGLHPLKAPSPPGNCL